MKNETAGIGPADAYTSHEPMDLQDYEQSALALSLSQLVEKKMSAFLDVKANNKSDASSQF